MTGDDRLSTGEQQVGMERRDPKEAVEQDSIEWKNRNKYKSGQQDKWQR